jgi:hypothetical protein
MTTEAQRPMIIDAETRDRLREALLSPDLNLVTGAGSATNPGSGEACTISEIVLTLTGKLSDRPHPCMSEVIRRWVIRVQDAMPDQVRNSREWRQAAVGIAGTASAPEHESQRRDLILGWMWDRLSDEDVLASVPGSVRPAWDKMLKLRTADAAYAADAAYWGRADPAKLLRELVAVSVR